MTTNIPDGVLVIIPLFARPVRASFKIDHEIRGEQLRALASIVLKHLQDLVPIVEILKHSGWEVLGGETSLICRHLSVQTKTQAEEALCQLGVDCGLYSVCDSTELEEPFQKLAENDTPKKEPGIRNTA